MEEDIVVLYSHNNLFEYNVQIELVYFWQYRLTLYNFCLIF